MGRYEKMRKNVERKRIEQKRRKGEWGTRRNVEKRKKRRKGESAAEGACLATPSAPRKERKSLVYANADEEN